jgi:hypothetical protein
MYTNLIIKFICDIVIDNNIPFSLIQKLYLNFMDK